VLHKQVHVKCRNTPFSFPERKKNRKGKDAAWQREMERNYEFILSREAKPIRGKTGGKERFPEKLAGGERNVEEK